MGPGSPTCFVFALAILLVYFVLAGQYEIVPSCYVVLQALAERRHRPAPQTPAPTSQP